MSRVIATLLRSSDRNGSETDARSLNLLLHPILRRRQNLSNVCNGSEVRIAFGRGDEDRAAAALRSGKEKSEVFAKRRVASSPCSERGGGLSGVEGEFDAVDGAARSLMHARIGPPFN